MSEVLNMWQLPETKLLIGIFQTSCAFLLNEQIWQLLLGSWKLIYVPEVFFYQTFFFSSTVQM